MLAASPSASPFVRVKDEQEMYWKAITPSPQGQWIAEIICSMPKRKVQESAKLIPPHLPPSPWVPRHLRTMCQTPASDQGKEAPTIMRSHHPRALILLKARARPPLREIFQSSHLTPIRPSLYQHHRAVLTFLSPLLI